MAHPGNSRETPSPFSWQVKDQRDFEGDHLGDLLYIENDLQIFPGSPELKPAVIVVMAKEPQAGKTKTRLVPPLNYQEAADLYEALLLDTIEMLSLLGLTDLAVAISPPELKTYFQTVTPPGTLLLPIECADIGDCLKQVLSELLRLGYHQAIAINADGPTLPSKYLQQALSNLEDHDVVFGEGHDGGYYLVGLKRNHSLLFDDIPWSTGKVLAKTIDRGRKIWINGCGDAKLV